MAADLARGGGSNSAAQGSTLEVCHAAEAARLQRLTQQAPLDYAAVAAVSGSMQLPQRMPQLPQRMPQLPQRMPQPLGAGYTFPWLPLQSTLHLPMVMPDSCLGAVALPCPALPCPALPCPALPCLPPADSAHPDRDERQ